MECLGVIPEEKKKARHRKEIWYPSVLNQRMSHGFIESVRSLEVRLRHKIDTGKIILVTSPIASEGKSTIAINLAQQLARNGKRVLFVDMDLRKQGDSKVLNVMHCQSIEEILKNKSAKGIHKINESNIYFMGQNRNLLISWLRKS